MTDITKTQPDNELADTADSEPSGLADLCEDVQQAINDCRDADNLEMEELLQTVLTALRNQTDRKAVLEEAARNEGFDRGTIVAASILLNCWGSEVGATEILCAANITLKRAEELDLDEYDSKVVLPLLRALADKGDA